MCGTAPNARRVSSPSPSFRSRTTRPDAKQAYFADGVTEALITDLAQIKGLRVTSRTSSMAYRGRRRRCPTSRANWASTWSSRVRWRATGDRVRVIAQLIDADSDQHLWARSYDRRGPAMSCRCRLEVATAIAREINIAMAPRLEQRFASRGTIDPAVV